jgi:hypothetical protein
MLSSFTLASADVVKASAQPDYRPAGIGVREADPLVAISAPQAEASDVSRIGGWVAIADGFAAGYLGAAIVLNVTLSRELLPMWPARSRPKT